jgi:hypothetical protein
VARGHIHLQETLADDVLALMLAHPRVRAARVATEKPDVYPDCDAVGVRGLRHQGGPPVTVTDQPWPRRGRAARTTDPRKAAFEANKLSKRLHRQVGQAIADFNMIEAGDKVMVCLSGGKDSHALLDMLISLRERAPVHFELVAVNLDQKQPGFPAHVLPAYLKRRGVPFHIENQDTYSIVKKLVPEGRRCAACARGCAAASSTAWPANWARPRSRSATTATTWW